MILDLSLLFGIKSKIMTDGLYNALSAAGTRRGGHAAEVLVLLVEVDGDDVRGRVVADEMGGTDRRLRIVTAIDLHGCLILARGYDVQLDRGERACASSGETDHQQPHSVRRQVEGSAMADPVPGGPRGWLDRREDRTARRRRPSGRSVRT